MAVYVYVWNETSISNMSGSGSPSISYTDDTTLTKRGWSFVTYQDVDQTSFPKGQAQNSDTGNVSTLDVTTTPSSGDRIAVFAMAKNPSATFSTWDTCTEQFDTQPSDMRMAVGEGNGGDNTTTVTTGATTSLILNAIVLGAASSGITQQAMYHYQNHGKI